MDLGVLLESPQGSKSSSQMGAYTCAFLQSGSSSVTLPNAWIKGSVAFPPGFPKGLSHRDVPRRTVLAVDPRPDSSRQCRENRFLWNGLRHLGDSGNGSTRWNSSRLSCGEPFLLRCDGNAGNSFPTKQGKDPSSRAMSLKRASSGCGWDLRASSRVEMGMSRNFLSCSKGVKDLLEVPEVRCD